LANNNNQDTEPAGCVPKIASDNALLCIAQVPNVDVDFNVPAWTLPFEEMVWVAYDNNTKDALAYRYFQWASPETLPNTPTWQLIPTDSNNTLAGYAGDGVPQISCDYQNGSGLDSVFNGNPNNDGAFAKTDVITFFTRGTATTGTGRMSFFGQSTGGEDDLEGLDDFQDGWGCADDWEPIVHKGASSMVMVR
jgi:hypothetical protein